MPSTIFSHPPETLYFSAVDDLDKTRRQIRLLTILATEDTTNSAEVHCTISTASLDDADLQYYACSYTWGDQNKMTSITVNGVEVQVRLTVYQMLCELRRWKMEEATNGSELQLVCNRFWLDYLCINQSNIEERNHQVTMMGDIYQSSIATISWLGQPTEQIEELFQKLNEIVDVPKSKESFENFMHSYKFRQSPVVGDKYGYKPPFNTSDYIELLSRPYWGRLWVLQEVVLANNVIIACGRYHVSWDRIELFISPGGSILKAAFGEQGSASVRSQMSIDLVFDTLIYQLSTLAVLRTERKRNSATYDESVPDLADLFINFSSCGCFDARDKVFGLLSLVDAEDKRRIVVDYNRTTRQVFRNCLQVARTKPRHSKDRETALMWAMCKPLNLANVFNWIYLSVTGGFQVSPLGWMDISEWWDLYKRGS